MRRLALAALALPAAQAAYVTAYRRLLRSTAGRLMAGDVDAFLRFYADDATLTFPGKNSWGPVYRGKDEIRGFLERFLRVGLRGEPREIAVTGPPWDTTVFVRFDDRATAPDGTVVYENRAVILLKGRWGKVVAEEVFEDTERVAAFDRWLEANEPAAAAA
ncbi:MAG: nuclear transport factor 2 family protein [Thermoleophilaceae bacterium]